jgi:hypothetical protein
LLIVVDVGSPCRGGGGTNLTVACIYSESCSIDSWLSHLLVSFALSLFFYIVSLRRSSVDQIEISSSGTASASSIQDNVDTSIHEAAHVLGMSSNSYRFFWDAETGESRTPRPFMLSTTACADGKVRSLILPAQNSTVQLFTENRQRYAIIVTPKVQTVARNQFNCQSLACAQLENHLTGSESCTGDHWGERL